MPINSEKQSLPLGERGRGGVEWGAEVKEEVQKQEQESSTVNAEYKLKTSQVNWRRNRKKPIGS